MKNKALADNPPEGNWATGNLNPLSPRKTNCSTWVANSTLSVFPVKKKQKLYLQFQFRVLVVIFSLKSFIIDIILEWTQSWFAHCSFIGDSRGVTSLAVTYCVKMLLILFLNPPLYFFCWASCLLLSHVGTRSSLIIY